MNAMTIAALAMYFTAFSMPPETAISTLSALQELAVATFSSSWQCDDAVAMFSVMPIFFYPF